MQNAGKPTKPESHYKKKKNVGRVNAWKKRGEKWWHPSFPNLIKYILLVEPIVEGWRCGGVVPWMPLHLQKIPLKMFLALLADFPANVGLCGSESDFSSILPTPRPFPPLLNPPGNSSAFIGEGTKVLPAKARLGRQQNISCIYKVKHLGYCPSLQQSCSLVDQR